MVTTKQFNKIVVLDNLLLFPEHKQTLEELGKEVVYYPSSTPETIKEAVRMQNKTDNVQCATELGIEALAEEELARRVDGADCVLTCWTGIPPKILEQNPQLQYIGFWTHDKNKIGVPEAEKRGVRVTYVPDYGTTAVAELAFAGILNLVRNVRKHEKSTLRGKWPYEQFKKGKKKVYASINQDHEPTPNDIKEFTLEGKTMGIVGMGRIGQRVAKIAKYGFGMNVIYTSRKRWVTKWIYDDEGITRGRRYISEGVIGKEDVEVNHGYRYTDLDEVMEADIISVHVSPSTPRHMIDGEMIKCMKDGAIFVNTSAGHVVDQEALFSELKTGRISAYLDVFDGLPPKKELKELRSNVLSTYRSGWYTRDSVTRKGDLFMQHILGYLQS
jgi:glycerate dehydrogenase